MTEVKKVMRLDVFSHNVKATEFDGRGKAALFEFCTRNAQYGQITVNRRTVRGIVAVYASATKDRSEFRFHRNQLPELLAHLRTYDITEDKIDMVMHGDYIPAQATFVKIDKNEPYEYQMPLIDYFVSPGSTKVITLQTGKGKTRILMESLLRIKQRTVLVIRGGFVDKWISDVKGFFGDRKKKLLVVRGSAHLNGLMQMALDGDLEADFIIITNRTLGDYYKKWEHYKGALGDAMIIPEEFYERLGAGIRAIDEVHMDYHLNFKQDTYTHVPKTISLSATLKSDDEFIRTRYRVMFPMSIRGADVVYDKYIAVSALGYDLISTKGIKYKNGKNYSHVEYENSIMKDKVLLRNYLAMIEKIMVVKYITHREDGQKMLIYASSIEMCTKIADYLAPMYPHLNIKRYVGVDEYDNLMVPDVVITTIKSAGTGHDIEGLRYVLMTDSINSIQANIQTMGRLRKMKGPWAHITPEFLYIFCVSIDKQVQYHMEKIEKFDGLVLGHKTLMTSFKI